MTSYSYDSIVSIEYKPCGGGCVGPGVGVGVGLSSSGPIGTR